MKTDKYLISFLSEKGYNEAKPKLEELGVKIISYMDMIQIANVSYSGDISALKSVKGVRSVEAENLHYTC